MDLFFVFIRFFKNLFVKDQGVQYIEDKIEREKLDTFTVNIQTRVNTYDDSIVTRYYEIVGLCPQKEICIYFKYKTNYVLNRICKDITNIIELHSDKKIKSKKLFKVLKNEYNGKVIVDGITINFKQTRY